MTNSTVESGGSTTEQVKDQVRDKAQLAQEKAQGALGQARGRLHDQVDQRSTQAGDQVQSTAQDVRSMAEQLRSQGKDTPARVAEQVADRAESFVTYLRDADGERLLRDVEDFARRQPWLIAAGGLALALPPHGSSRPPAAAATRAGPTGRTPTRAATTQPRSRGPRSPPTPPTPAPTTPPKPHSPKPTWSHQWRPPMTPPRR
jgi:hypothetical protein